MPFKLNRLKIIIMTALMLSLFLSGCSYFFDKKEKEKEIKFSSQHADCMAASGHVLNKYFKDFSNVELAQNNMIELGLCYQKAIDTFVKFTKNGGDESSYYTVERFESFFEKFYPQMGMSVGKIKGYIEIKSFFVGGAKDTVSKKELLAVAEILPKFTGALSELSQYREILLGKASPTQDREGKIEFYKAFSLLKTVSGHLIHSLKPWSGDWSVDLQSLGRFVVDQYYSDEVEDEMSIVDMLTSFKNMSLNEKGQLLKRKDLSSFIIQIIRTHEAISEFNYFVRDEEFFDSLGTIVSFIVKIPSQLKLGKKFKGEALSSLVNIVSISSEILLSSIKRSEKQIIDTDKVSDLIDKMEKAKIMKGRLSASTLSYFINEFSKKWLISSRKKIGKNIDREKIQYVSQSVHQWSERQKHINDRLKDSESISLIDLSKNTKNKNVKKWLTVYSKTALHQWLPDGRIKYSSNTSDLNYEELTVFNSLYSLVNIFMKPFSLGTRDPFQYTVKVEEAQEVYDVLRILGLEMAFVDARVLTSGENSFLEGNNFTTQKRSNKILDFYEAYELMSVHFSSGILAKKIHKTLSETEPSECLLELKDVFQKRVIKRKCFVEHMKKNVEDYFSHLTNFMSYWGDASEDEKESFLAAIEIAARGGSFSEKPFDMGEIRVLSGTMYYMESIFHNFDQDNDGYIFKDEIFAAKDHFQPLLINFILKNRSDILTALEGLGGKTGMENLRTTIAPRIFLYLLRHGELPSEGKVAQAHLYYAPDTAYEFWAGTQNEGKVKIDRVISIFATLAITTGIGHRARVADFLLKNKEPLFKDLSRSDVPDCRVEKNLPFCKWARLIYCNETVNSDLFEWMHLSQTLLFPEEGWKSDKEATIEKAMVDMSRFFRAPDISGIPNIFSTQCAFPEVEPVKSYWESVRGNSYLKKEE